MLKRKQDNNNKLYAYLQHNSHIHVKNQ